MNWLQRARSIGSIARYRIRASSKGDHLKRSEHDAKVLQVLRKHFELEEFTAVSVVSQCTGLAANANRELAVGLHNLDPKLARSGLSLGHVLKRCQGRVVDGWRLCFKSDRHKKSWFYWFAPADESAPVLTVQES